MSTLSIRLGSRWTILHRPSLPRRTTRVLVRGNTNVGSSLLTTPREEVAGDSGAGDAPYASLKDPGRSPRRPAATTSLPGHPYCPLPGGVGLLRNQRGPAAPDRKCADTRTTPVPLGAAGGYRIRWRDGRPTGESLPAPGCLVWCCREEHRVRLPHGQGVALQADAPLGNLAIHIPLERGVRVLYIASRLQRFSRSFSAMAFIG